LARIGCKHAVSYARRYRFCLMSYGDVGASALRGTEPRPRAASVRQRRSVIGTSRRSRSEPLKRDRKSARGSDSGRWKPTVPRAGSHPTETQPSALGNGHKGATARAKPIAGMAHSRRFRPFAGTRSNRRSRPNCDIGRAVSWRPLPDPTADLWTLSACERIGPSLTLRRPQSAIGPLQYCAHRRFQRDS
jgi:hypothetical protein